MFVGVSTMAVFANTIKGFMPGRINRQTVTQEPGTFGTYKETESKVLNKNGEPYMNTSFVKSFDDRSFDIEKASEMPIKPNIQLTDEQVMEGMLNPGIDDRSFVKVKTGPKLTKVAQINLPQR